MDEDKFKIVKNKLMDIQPQINGVKADYYLFHYNRISNILLGLQTPYNDYNEGVSEAGNYRIPLSDYKVILNTVISSLNNMGFINSTLRERLEEVIDNWDPNGLSALFS